MQTLAILLIHPSVAVFEYSVCQILELLAKALLAVDHLANFIFRMHLRGFKAGGHFTEIGLQRRIDIAQAAQFVIEQLALFAPVGLLHQLLAGSAQLNIQLATLFDEVGSDLVGARFGRQPAHNQPSGQRHNGTNNNRDIHNAPCGNHLRHKIELCCTNVQLERFFLRGATQKRKAGEPGLLQKG
uniref:Uncharacterized protein n=1 Tax=Klebsiella sp. T17-2 TaxID=1778873 RepID=A0A140D6L3_9ENTR|nr:hypothetical protein [Klebsiella sp. T17-2]